MGSVRVDWEGGEVLAEGLEFPEGPIAVGGGEVVFAQIRGQRLSRCAGGRVETIARTGGGANGATIGPGGVYYVANNGGLSMGPQGGLWMADEPIPGRIQRVTPDGELSDLAVDLPGDRKRCVDPRFRGTLRAAIFFGEEGGHGEEVEGADGAGPLLAGASGGVRAVGAVGEGVRAAPPAVDPRVLPVAQAAADAGGAGDFGGGAEGDEPVGSERPVHAGRDRRGPAIACGCPTGRWWSGKGGSATSWAGCSER